MFERVGWEFIKRYGGVFAEGDVVLKLPKGKTSHRTNTMNTCILFILFSASWRSKEYLGSARRHVDASYG